MQFAIHDEKDVRAGGFRHQPAPVQHQRVGIAFLLRLSLCQRRDDIQSRGLRLDRSGVRRRPAPVRLSHSDPLHPFGAKVAGPRPRPDRQMDRGSGGRNRQLLRPAPRDRANVSVGQPVGLQHRGAGGIDLFRGPRDFKVEDAAEVDQAV